MMIKVWKIKLFCMKVNIHMLAKKIKSLWLLKNWNNLRLKTRGAILQPTQF
jgi:hypothetical protein